ncbi:DUF4124 domain-containing protein [Alkanindiges sp. WGS2144]|uniref:DUF4124 domain-containing protein n=1 Tax=Alkanindiges sp. WGS2144 TaxID=3366808 RepID=UPI003750070B
MPKIKLNPQTFTCSALALGLGTVLFAGTANAQAFYKWVDKDGSTHYTQTPPPGSRGKNIKRIVVDDMAPATPTAARETSADSASNSNAPGNSSQLAQAATAGSIPDNRQTPQPAPATTNQPSQQPTANIPVITPPPANRLITPEQEEVRPAFSER